MTREDYRDFCVFLISCLTVKDRAWVERMAAERAGTPQGRMLRLELAFHDLEQKHGHAAAQDMWDTVVARLIEEDTTTANQGRAA